MPRLPLLQGSLDDGRVRLRDAAERDIPEILIAYEDDPELHLRLAQERPPSGAELGRLAESERADRAAGSRASLAILTADSDTCVGQIAVHPLDWDNGRAELSLWVAPPQRGRGLGTGALRLVGGWLLGPCGLERVQLVCETANQALLASAARAGFVHEGVLKGYLRLRSRRIDVAMLSLLRTDLQTALDAERGDG